ncbi:MAG: CinA family protein [Bacteroidales bacterium]|jgi:nicotinamide-nucleotide amidase|nr:CinA family protein [Bacteroidales bacterium]
MHHHLIMEKIKNTNSPFLRKDDKELLKNLTDYLIQKKNTLSTAESCTGGYLSHLFTSIPGSSAYFKGGVIAYANEIKERILLVPKEILLTDGAVSENTVFLMAKNCKKTLQTDYAIAVSGIAGPDGGTIEKPVGTVWIAIASNKKVHTQLFRFGNMTRKEIIYQSAFQAIKLLTNIIENE